MPRFAAFALLVSLACVPIATAEPPVTSGEAALAALLEPIRAEHDAPALAGAIVVADGVTVGAVGTRRAGGEGPVTPQDLWHLGSCTKAMTATLVARMVERGELEWTTTLADVFPDLAGQMHEQWRSVTIEQLLCNRGGAPKDLDRDGLWGTLSKHEGTPAEGRRVLLTALTKHPPEYDPGSQNLYSNAGFTIAGHMVETVAATPWEELIQREVFQPLGITTAGFGAPGTAAGDGSPDQPRGHRRGKAPVEPGPRADNPPTIGPAGTVHMSLADWARFVRAHVAGAAGEAVHSGDGSVFLSTASFEKMHAPGGGSREGYAMGWGIASRPWAKGDAEGDTGRVLSHAGSNTMWYCVAWLAPERGFAVLVTTNVAGEDAAKMADEAASALIRHALAEAPK